jgi:hypothetical protein
MVDCPECDASMWGWGACRKCGWTPKAEAPPPQKKMPAYREFPERTVERSKLTDRCTEPDCGKTVAEHIAECLEAIRHMQERNEAVKL